MVTLEGEEAKAFNAYARRESTPEEKEKLRKALDFYLRTIDKPGKIK